MDRNDEQAAQLFKLLAVATREGGVDRNVFEKVLEAVAPLSPPARVAWIETVSSALFRPLPNVIARKVWRR